MIPHFLYHYTNAETLIQILESKKIRFKRLDLLNDPYEGYIKTKESDKVISDKANVIFCSCWNGSSEENIALWYVYTNVSGVRIKMKSEVFGRFSKLVEQPSGYVPVTPIKNIDIKSETTIQEVKGPIKIAYEETEAGLYDQAVGRSVVNKDTEREFMMNDIDLDEVGIKKIKHWSYENEWRYKICPYKQIHASDRALDYKISRDFPEYIDVPFKAEIEEILLAPQILEKDVDMIKEYLNVNKLNIPIRESVIKTRF